MKRLILLASIAIAAIVSQPAKAQVSINVNIGARPYYTPTYYNGYYVPARTVVYGPPAVYHRPVVYHKRYVAHRSYYTPTRVYHSSYYRPAPRHYTVKHVKYHGNKHGNGHGRGRH